MLTKKSNLVAAYASRVLHLNSECFGETMREIVHQSLVSNLDWFKVENMIT